LYVVRVECETVPIGQAGRTADAPKSQIAGDSPTAVQVARIFEVPVGRSLDQDCTKQEYFRGRSGRQGFDDGFPRVEETDLIVTQADVLGEEGFKAGIGL
jgi:hypothetical protein